MKSRAAGAAVPHQVIAVKNGNAEVARVLRSRWTVGNDMSTPNRRKVSPIGAVSSRAL